MLSEKLMMAVRILRKEKIAEEGKNVEKIIEDFNFENPNSVKETENIFHKIQRVILLTSLKELSTAQR